MYLLQKKDVELAVLNIINHGDTDVFPFPIDNYVFRDKTAQVIEHIINFHKEFTDDYGFLHPLNIKTCAPVGYTGFRWVTHIEPIWNAYLLSLVISIGEEIEKTRISKDKSVIHSYRFAPDYQSGNLFDNNYNWLSFQRQSMDIAREAKYNYVITCDIADFYNRIYLHRVDNAIKQLDVNSDIGWRIMEILTKISGTSYGLPIGGPARILAEITLDSIDKILDTEGIAFSRFVDDIHIFAESEEQAHAHLIFLERKLMNNEGLTLQKHKTQILSKAEFLNLTNSRIYAESEDAQSEKRAKFMSLPVNYDPYSQTANEDYERLKEELSKYNITELLNEELRKTRIHQQFSKHLLKALKVLDDNVVSSAIVAMSERIEKLYPVFPSFMLAVFANFEKLNEEAKNCIVSKLRELIEKNSYIVQVELNVAYLIKVIGKQHTTANRELLAKLYRKNQNSLLIKTGVMQVFANWKISFWYFDIKENYLSFTPWEKKLFIVSTYFLKDSGDFWRKKFKNSFTPYEKIIRDWAADRFSSSTWTVPL